MNNKKRETTYIKKCEICEKEVPQSYTKGNFFIKIMNQRTDNIHNGEKADILLFCSWNCFEEFEKAES